VLADFCASQDPNFNRERWIDYIAGSAGEWSEKQNIDLTTSLLVSTGLKQPHPYRLRSCSKRMPSAGTRYVLYKSF
jgi:hypothetical protein